MICNEKGIKGVKELLSQFSDEELSNLAKTVTQGCLLKRLMSRDDAEDAILKYSKDEISLLRRRCITKDHLFTYLHNRSIVVALPVTKDLLVDKIIGLWISNIPKTEESSFSNITENIKQSDAEVQVMAKQFSEWFYSMMNQNSCIDIEHFYADARLKINFIYGQESSTEETKNSPQEISEMLFKAKVQHNLFFNPNLTSDGTKGKMDAHGLVMVMVCGTLHIASSVAGVFEQIFGLARDPHAENNWKIKCTELILRSAGDVRDPPKLCDEPFSNKLLPD